MNFENSEIDQRAFNVEEEIQRLQEERVRFREKQIQFLDSGDDFDEEFGVPDFMYWGRQPYWTLQEIACLSLGKDPAYLNVDTCQRLCPGGELAQNFVKRFETACRWGQVGRLDSRTRPSEALYWLAQVKLAYPTELEAAVTALGDTFIDWPTEYENLRQQTGQVQTDYDQFRRKHFDVLHARESELLLLYDWAEKANSAIDDQQQQIVRLQEIVSAKTLEIDGLKETLRDVETADEMGENERTSFQKMILGMALEQYGYDPTQKRSETPTRIIEDLDSHGLSLDLKTCRGKLRDAADKLLPSDGDA